MKKTYYSPKVKVVNIKPAHNLLAGSIKINSTEDAVSAGDAASRSSRFSGWEDIDEEE